MKKITLLLALLISSIGFSQDLLLGFETGESGGVNGGPFGNMAAPTVMAGSGTNTSEVLQIVGNSAAEVWQGINLNLSDNVDLSTTQTMTIDVFSATPITFLVKINGGLSGAPEAAAEVSHNGDSTWQTISFTFDTALDNKAAAANGVYASFVIHAYWKAGETDFGAVTKDERTFMVDNISGPKAGAPAPDPVPTTAPTNPPSFDAQNVVSLYSEAYTPAATINNVPWDDSEFEEITVAGNKILKVTGANFLGLDLSAHIDATSMTHLHMDYWIATNYTPGQVLNPKLSNHGAQAGETSAIDISNPINSQAEVKNWQSKSFPLNGARESIKQFLITQAGFSGIFYIDNIYMYVDGTAGVDDVSFANVNLYPNPAQNILNISAENTIQKLSIYNIIGKEVKSIAINDTSKNIDISDLNSGIYVIKYSIDNKVGTSKFIKK